MPDYKQTSTYVPALPEIAPPPTPLPEAPSIARDVSAAGAWFVLTVANVIVATVIIVGMLVDGSSAGNAILLGAAYFFPTMAIFVLALTGTFTDVIRSAQRERTERQRIDVYADLGGQAIAWRIAVEDNRRLELERDNLPATLSKRLTQLESRLDDVYSLPAEGLQPPPHVTPYDNRKRGAFAAETQPAQDTTREEAIRWAMQLYNDLGDPHPHYVQLTGKPEARGRIQNISVIGSARGAGSEEARLWLLQRRVLLKRPGGYALNLELAPTSRELRYVK